MMQESNDNTPSFPNKPHFHPFFGAMCLCATVRNPLNEAATHEA